VVAKTDALVREGLYESSDKALSQPSSCVLPSARLRDRKKAGMLFVQAL
jgi:hypothetical protein